MSDIFQVQQVDNDLTFNLIAHSLCNLQYQFLWCIVRDMGFYILHFTLVSTVKRTALKCRNLGASQMCLVLFLPVQSLNTCFRGCLTRFADFVSLFRHCNFFSGSPTAVHCAFLFFNAKAWPQSQADLFTCTMVLHCRHTFLRCIDLLRYCTVGIYTFLNLS